MGRASNRKKARREAARRTRRATQGSRAGAGPLPAVLSLAAAREAVA